MTTGFPSSGHAIESLEVAGEDGDSGPLASCICSGPSCLQPQSKTQKLPLTQIGWDHRAGGCTAARAGHSGATLVHGMAAHPGRLCCG